MWRRRSTGACIGTSSPGPGTRRAGRVHRAGTPAGTLSRNEIGCNVTVYKDVYEEREKWGGATLPTRFLSDIEASDIEKRKPAAGLSGRKEERMNMQMTEKLLEKVTKGEGPWQVNCVFAGLDFPKDKEHA